MVTLTVKLIVELIFFYSFSTTAGAFLNFFGDVCDKKSITEFILQGIKLRPNREPLPDIPSPTTSNDRDSDVTVCTNGLGGGGVDDTYASISDFRPAPGDSPYVEVRFSVYFRKKKKHSVIFHSFLVPTPLNNQSDFKRQ